MIGFIEIMVLRSQPENRHMRMSRRPRIMRLTNRRRRFQQRIKRPAQQRDLLPGHDRVRATPQRGNIRENLLTAPNSRFCRSRIPAIVSRAPSEIGDRCSIHPSNKGSNERTAARLPLLRKVQKQLAGVRKYRDRITLLALITLQLQSIAIRKRTCHPDGRKIGVWQRFSSHTRSGVNQLSQSVEQHHRIPHAPKANK